MYFGEIRMHLCVDSISVVVVVYLRNITYFQHKTNFTKRYKHPNLFGNRNYPPESLRPLCTLPTGSTKARWDSGSGSRKEGTVSCPSYVSVGTPMWRLGHILPSARSISIWWSSKCTWNCLENQLLELPFVYQFVTTLKPALLKSVGIITVTFLFVDLETKLVVV